MGIFSIALARRHRGVDLATRVSASRRAWASLGQRTKTHSPTGGADQPGPAAQPGPVDQPGPADQPRPADQNTFTDGRNGPPGPGPGPAPHPDPDMDSDWHRTCTRTRTWTRTAPGSGPGTAPHPDPDPDLDRHCTRATRAAGLGQLAGQGRPRKR